MTLRPHPAARRPAAPRRQRGLTLVELMVALTLSLLVTLAAVGALLFSRQGANAMDQSALLRDNGRFATELIRRITLQAGYESMLSSTNRRQEEGRFRTSNVDPDPDVRGINNALVTAADPTAPAQNSRPGSCGGVSDSRCVNGSDILIVRHQGSGPAGTPDMTMINCAGLGESDAVTNATRPISVFHVQVNNAGEPTLRCSYRDWAAATWVTRDLIEGVETFQVLYGTDQVTPNTAPLPAASAPTDSVNDRYLRADEIVVPGNDVATRDNWRRVRSIRVGMVLRGAAGSAIDRGTTAVTSRYPLGQAMASANDAFTTFTPPADGRLRQVVTFTVHLRNNQGVNP